MPCHASCCCCCCSSYWVRGCYTPPIRPRFHSSITSSSYQPAGAVPNIASWLTPLPVRLDYCFSHSHARCPSPACIAVSRCVFAALCCCCVAASWVWGISLECAIAFPSLDYFPPLLSSFSIVFLSFLTPWFSFPLSSSPSLCPSLCVVAGHSNSKHMA